MNHGPVREWFGWLRSPSAFQVVLVGLVASSSVALVVQGGGSLRELVAGLVAGLLLGVVVTGYLTSITPTNDDGGEIDR